MKIRLTCNLPKELIGVGAVLAFIGTLAGCVLIVKYLVDTYGAQIQQAQSVAGMNMILIGYIIAFLVWFGLGWAADGEAKSLEGRQAVMIIVTIIQFLAALLFAPLLHAISIGSNYIVGMDWGIMIFGFASMLGGFLAGWLTHWAKRCIQIEPNAGGAAS